MAVTHFIEEIFYPGNLAKVEFYDEASKKMSIQCCVHSFELEQLVLHILNLGDLQERLYKTGTEVTLICQFAEDEPTKYFFTAQILEAPTEAQPFLRLSRPAKVLVASRRNFFRCDVSLDFMYIIDGKEYKGLVTNLSACGMYVTVAPNKHLRMGMAIKGYFTLPTLHEPMDFEGRIVRLENSESGWKQGIAINFENVDEAWQNKVIKYLFQRQRELIRRGYIKVFR